MSVDNYIVETKSGEWKEWYSTPLKRLFKKAPKIQNGMIKLENRPYVIDPRKMRIERYRKLRTLFLREYELRIQLWRENEPDAIDFFGSQTTPGSIGVTSETIQLFSKSEHLRRLVQPDRDWILIISMAILSALAAGAIGYSLGLIGLGNGGNGAP